MRARATRTGLVLLLAGGSSLLGPAALADAPVDQGWWTTTNESGLLPVAPPAAPAPVPSDVPADGLLVQGGPQAPTAYAGLVYDVEPGLSLDQLVLKVAPSSATTPTASLQLCPLKTQFINAEQGGPMTDAPAYDCATSVTAAPSSDGTYSFSVGRLADGSTLAVAVLPTSPVDRVALSKPGVDSLVTSGTPTGGGSFSQTPSGEPPAAAPGAPAAQPAPLPGVPAVPMQPTTAPCPGPALAGAQPPGGQATAPTALAASRQDGSGRSLRAILLLTMLGLAAALWSIAGRQAEETEDAGGAAAA